MGRNSRIYIMDTKIFEDDDVFGRCMKRVSAYRREKVSRLRFRGDKNASLAAGVLLSYALREYAGIDEHACTYVKEKGGKPYIVCGSDAQYRLDSTSFGGDSFCAMAHRQNVSEVQFSLSHTDGLVGVIVGDVPCGIDAERVKVFPESIVNRIFSDKDREMALSFEDDGDRDRYCARVWTRREAYGKLTGDGVLMNDEAQKRVMDDEYMGSRGVYLQNIDINTKDGSLSPAFGIEDSRRVEPSSAGFDYVVAVCIGRGIYIDGIVPGENKIAPEFVSSKHLVLSRLKW